MLALPLAMVGALGALFAANMTLNLFSLIGIILLFGLVTKNSILLVDYANQLRATGLDGETFAWGLLDHGGVSLLPGTGFGASVTGHVRFSLTMPAAILEDACNRIEGYARSLESLSASA